MSWFQWNSTFLKKTSGSWRNLSLGKGEGDYGTRSIDVYLLETNWRYHWIVHITFHQRIPLNRLVLLTPYCTAEWWNIAQLSIEKQVLSKGTKRMGAWDVFKGDSPDYVRASSIKHQWLACQSNSQAHNPAPWELLCHQSNSWPLKWLLSDAWAIIW